MKALFLPFAPSLAHVTRCLAVAEAWRSAGNEAFFAVGKERTAFIADNGFPVYEVPEVSKAAFQNDRGFKWLTKRFFSESVERETVIAREVGPDVIIYDFRFSPPVTGHVIGRPAIGIAHGNVTLLADHPEKAANLIFSPDKTNGPNPRSAIILKGFPFVFQCIMRMAAGRLNGCLKRNGMRPVKTPFRLLYGDYTLFADIPDLIPVPLHASSRIVGPLLWSGWSRPEPVLSEIGTAPLIYVTMGTTVESSRLLARLVESLQGSPYFAVVSTGGVEPGLKAVPENIRILTYVSGQTIIDRSKLVIHHGGHETLMQALAAGVPSLVVPVNPDQIILSRQIIEHGFGGRLRDPDAFPMDENPIRTFTADDIRTAIDGTIGNSDIADACRQAKETVRSFRSADVVDTIKGFVGSPAVRSPE